MRFTVFLFLLLSCSSFCLAQTDSMFVEMQNGSILAYPISSIYQISFSKISTNVKERELMQNVLSSFTLYQNYPNPFNPSTTIQYYVPKPGNVEVNIYDIQGRLVKSISKSVQQAGLHSMEWNSQSNSGISVASGTYFCQVLFNGSSLVKKLVLIK
jgi:hypothetical protein